MNEHCLKAASAIVTRGEYATVDAVVRSVCAAHGVQCIEQLGATVHSLPALSLLLHIEHAVATCAAAFVATHGIACLCDFEREVVSALHAQCAPPLSSSCVTAAQVAAPSSFAGFMVGPLVRHPAVSGRWPLAYAFDPGVALGYVDAAQLALELLARTPAATSIHGHGSSHRHVGGHVSGHDSGHGSSHGWSSATPTEPVLDATALGTHIERRTGRSLGQLGVQLAPHRLPAVAHSLRHALHALRELEASATKLALEQLHARPEHAALEERRRHSAAPPPRRKIVPGSLPRLRPPRQPAVAKLLAACEGSLSGRGSPSAAKVRSPTISHDLQ